ncbi:hypothetical protein [Photobacterium kishitanii]|uniref:hypothetical protein n=1 Tax=Photobacterium kishitanii TaxID=318456 RepID=UPI000D173A5E|nr:hypothetical protein [Photobacterium kishitanii]PSU15613.1 hypothetical protein CTM84_20230 [Photobacterium kishitanii]
MDIITVFNGKKMVDPYGALVSDKDQTNNYWWDKERSRMTVSTFIVFEANIGKAAQDTYATLYF